MSRAAAALTVVVAAAAALALHWVFLVPIYQSPDEVVLFDYMLAIHERGHLITVRDGPDGLGHPWSAYLAGATGVERIAFHANVRAVPDYGSGDFFRRLDRGAPPGSASTGQIPFLVSRYPVMYFALGALWLSAVAAIAGEGPVELFFGARILNVGLLVLSLLATYAAFRELRLGPWRSVLLVAAIGLFPMVTFVSAYNQADNLGFTLVATSGWLALRARRLAGSGRSALPSVAGLGLALGLLVATKYQFWLCMAAATGAALASEAWFRRLAPARLAGPALLLAVPSVLGWGLQTWIGYGSGRPLVFHTHVAPGIWTDVAIREAWHAGGAAGLAVFAVDRTRGLLANLYGPQGDTFRGFWGHFGWMDTPLVFRSPRLDFLVKAAAQFLSVGVLVLVLARIEQSAARLLRIARRGRGRWAARIALGNPVVVSLYAFAAFMAAFYVYTDNTFFAQGRNWLPWVPAIFLVATWYAPRALSAPGARRLLGSGLLALLVVYSVVGSLYAERDVHRRYYDNGRAVRPAGLAGLPQAAPGRFAAAVDYADVGPVSYFKVRPTLEGDAGPTLSIAVAGFAFDRQAGAPARAVFVIVDGGRDVQAVVGDQRDDLVPTLGAASARSGFDLVLYVADLPPGLHRLTFRALSADGRAWAELPLGIEFER